MTSSTSDRAARMLTRAIPSTGESLPVVGCGTYKGFDVGPRSAAYKRLPGVVQTLLDAGGSVLDSSPMYGRAEKTVGEVVDTSAIRDRVFLATKVWTHGRDEGIAQMEHSLALLKTPRIDLMQIHNLVDWRTHLPTLRAWKEAGRLRYIGVTHYTDSAHDELEAMLRAEPVDFVQLNYAVTDRAAEARLLPLAQERGIAVLVTVPLGAGALVRQASRKPLPAWAADFECDAWPQLMLKFVLGHPAVTCAIPGTANPDHMTANARAGCGPMPDEMWRARIAQAWES